MRNLASDGRRLTWANTRARSGKYKDASTVMPALTAEAQHQSSRRYKVRFRQDVSSRSKRQRRSSASHERNGSQPTSAPTDRYHRVTESEGAEMSSVAKPLLSFFSPSHEAAQVLWSFGSEPRTDDVIQAAQTSRSNADDDIQTADVLSLCDPLLESQDANTPNTSEALLLTFQDDVFPQLARNLSPIPIMGVEQLNVDRRFFLQYYIERVVARLMPLWNTPDNPFISIVVPASFDSPILTHAIMALASYHYSLQPSTAQSRQNSAKAFWHQQQVLALLQKNLQQLDILRDDSTLAACMLMQTFEVLCSGTTGWDLWLRGAALFVKMRGRLEHDLKDSNSWMRLAKCVVAVETFAATSADFELTVSGDYWNIYRRIREGELRKIAKGGRGQDFAEDSHFEKLVGCSAVVVYALGRMQMLIESRNEVERLCQDDVRWYEAYTIEESKLEDLLLRWRPETSDPDKRHLAEAFRHAALIFHSRSLRRMPYDSHTVQFRVQSTFDNLLSLTNSSKLEGIALYPTLIAALEIDETQNTVLQSAAINRIRVMKREKGDPLYDNAEKLLHLVWSKRKFAETDEERRSIDWRDVSKEMDWKWCMV